MSLVLYKMVEGQRKRFSNKTPPSTYEVILTIGLDLIMKVVCQFLI